MNFNQATFLKISAVAIAIPRYAGAFALSAGFVATGYMHIGLGIAEVLAGIAMAILEGFAIAFILNKWRLLKSNSVAWYALIVVTSLLALSMPLVAIPYLFYYQAGFDDINALFNSIWLQNAWNFVVAGVPMVVVVGVGLADVNELEKEEEAIDFELESSRKRAELEMELSTLELQVERARVQNELEKKRLRAVYRVEASAVEAQEQDNLNKPFVCPHCKTGFERVRQLNGHLGQCKAKQNGDREQHTQAMSLGEGSSDE